RFSRRDGNQTILWSRKSNSKKNVSIRYFYRGRFKNKIQRVLRRTFWENGRSFLFYSTRFTTFTRTPFSHQKIFGSRAYFSKKPYLRIIHDGTIGRDSQESSF